MTNPYQHGFLDSSNTPRPFRRLSVYPPAHAPTTSYDQTARFSRGAGAFSHLLNPATSHDGISASSSDPTSPGRRHSRNGATTDMDLERNGSGPSHGSSGQRPARSWSMRASPLAPFSRAFEPYMGSMVGDGGSLAGVSMANSASNTSFVWPSYLAHSTYVQKLAEAHRARVASQREFQLQQAQIGASSNGLSASSSHAKPAAHRGMAYEVVEKPPPFVEDDETLPQLPTRWNRDDKWGGLEVSPDGLEVKYTALRGQSERDHEACAIRADHYMPPQCGIYYFEVTILSGKRDDTTIGIGFSGKSVALSRAPGWEPESWGYHGDDGNSFAAQNAGKQYGPPFSTMDVIGCGINFRTGHAFFTKNGNSLGTAFREVRGNVKLYPSVGLKKTGEHIRVNFGQTKFIFDIDGMIEKEKAFIQREIAETSTTRLAPGLSETDLVQTLVLQFLQHEGYVETARAFANEIQTEKQNLSLDPNDPVAGINIRDDEDASNRQRIRRAILEGDIDRAIKHTRANYPRVLVENEEVLFRLNCQKFIEMVRTAADRKRVDTKKRNGQPHGIVDLGTQAMDVDTMGGGSDSMDTDGPTKDWIMSLEQETMTFGSELSAKYGKTPGAMAELKEIFSLMAFTDPYQALGAHRLDRKRRVAVAEELNSAILASLGKSSRAALEKVYAQTTVLLEDLSKGGGPGSFVSLKEIIDDISRAPGY